MRVSVASVASVWALILSGSVAHAQEAPPQPSPNPVEEQEVEASEGTQPAPATGSGEPVQATPLASQAATPAKEEKWDVMNPRRATLRQVNIRTDEGTSMDVDVSPDGRIVAFSMLGDIYTMPIGGGAPTRIAEGLAREI